MANVCLESQTAQIILPQVIMPRVIMSGIQIVKIRYCVEPS